MSKVQFVRIGSAEWEQYVKYMKAQFKLWSSVDQATWILANPEDYVRFNNELRDETISILLNAGFAFPKIA